MDSDILTLLQGLSDPGDLAGGICSFFKKHMARVSDILTKIINSTPADPDENVENLDLGSGFLVLSNDDQYSKLVHLSDLSSVLKKVINNEEVIPEVPVEVRDYYHSVTTTEYLSYDQVVNMIREQSEVADAIVTTLTSFQDWVNNPDLNFEQLTLERVNNLLPSTSVVSEKLRQGISSISTRFANSIDEYKPSVLQNIMSLFGINSNTYSDQQISTFSGINAWTVVLGDVVDGVSVLVSKIPVYTARLFATIGYGISMAVLYGAARIASGVEKTILSLTGATDAFKKNIVGGDRSVSGCDWRYTIDDGYTTVGDQAFLDLTTALHDFWMGHSFHEVSIPLFAGALNIQQLDENQTGFNLRLKPLNCTAINVAWNKIMDGSHLYYKLIQSDAGLISRNNSSNDYPSSLNRAKLAQFFSELAKNPDLYYLDSWKTDADAFMACQAAKIICFMQLLLMMDDVPTPPGFLGMLLNCSELADFDIENEPNYNSGTGKIEPSNYNMISYLSSVKKFTTAFNNSSGNFNEYLPNDYTTIANLDTVWRFLTAVIAVLEDLEVLDESSLTCFLPYQTTIVYKKASFYIPSDTDNIDLVKGIIKAGLTVAAIATIVVIGLAVRSAIKKKAFALEAKAGQLSWDAVENKNSSDLKKAYKLQKRANLLSLIGGTSSGNTVEAVNGIINNQSNVNVTIVDILKAITG